MKKVLIAVGLFALLAGAGTYFYMTPYFALNSMRRAAETGDAAALSSYVDYPSVRAGIKSGLTSRTNALVGTAGVAQNPFAQLGVAFASAMADTAIDAMVTPQALALILNGVKPVPGAPPPTALSSLESSEHYDDYSTFSVTLRHASMPSLPVGLVLTRHGLASWQLSDVRLP